MIFKGIVSLIGACLTTYQDTEVVYVTISDSLSILFVVKVLKNIYQFLMFTSRRNSFEGKIVES